MDLILPAYETPHGNPAGSYGPLAIAWARRRLKLDMGPWQDYSLTRILEHDGNGDLIHSLAVLSVARQNGKSVIVRVLVGWLLDEGYKLPALSDWKFVLLAAHDGRQARLPYEFVRADLESYATIEAYGMSARRGDAKVSRSTRFQGLERNGVKVDVATSQAGSARGISAGLIAFDEVLTQTDFAMYEVLSPAQSAVRNSLMLMTSTAGFANSAVLRLMYDRIQRQASGAERFDPSFLGLWWCADDDEVAPPDWDGIRRASPALDDGRLSRRAIEAEYAILPRGSWVRERLNRWMDERVDAPFSLEAWGACRDSNALHPSKLQEDVGYTVAVDVESIWTEGAIVIAAPRTDRRVGVEVHRFLQSSTLTPLKATDFTREIAGLCKRYKVDAVVYRQSSNLGPALERMASENGARVIGLPGPKVATACSDFAEAVLSRRIAVDDPYLDSQIATAKRRRVGASEAWTWAIADHPANGLVAMTLAVNRAAKVAPGIQVFL